MRHALREVDAELAHRLDDRRVHALGGLEPAERASWRPCAARAKSASAICERPAFWMQTKSARAIAYACTSTRPPSTRTG